MAWYGHQVVTHGIISEVAASTGHGQTDRQTDGFVISIAECLLHNSR